MRKEDIQEYLSDEALEALIRETEEGPMIKAPEYLEENILHKIEQQQKVIAVSYTHLTRKHFGNIQRK